MIFEDHELVTLMEDIVDPFNMGGRGLTDEEREALKIKHKTRRKPSLLSDIFITDTDKISTIKFRCFLTAENYIPTIYSDEFYDSIVIDTDDITIKSQKFKQGVLLEDDKRLLIEYAPKLFNTLLETKTEIMDKMFELVNLVWKYRLYNDPHFIINRMRDNFPTIYENALPQKKQALISAIDTVLELMGGDIDAKGDTELKKQLREVRKNPSKHIPKKPPNPSTPNIKDYTSLTTIKNYLSSLKLDKKKVIDEFKEKLEKIP